MSIAEAENWFVVTSDNVKQDASALGSVHVRCAEVLWVEQRRFFRAARKVRSQP